MVELHNQVPLTQVEVAEVLQQQEQMQRQELVVQEQRLL
jgi:hypothetical protein